MALTDAGRSKAGGRLSGADRARAWLVTGPLGRGAAFAADFAAALRALRRQRR